MSSVYYMELDETAKARYDEKLSCNGNKLPDPFDQSTIEHVLVYNKKLWPPITFGDIYMYLVEKECTYTREKMRNHKSLDAFNYVLSGKCSFRLGEVCSHVVVLLFAVEMANNESPAPTSVAFLWNKTSKKVDPVQVSAINFSRKRKCKQKVFVCRQGEHLSWGNSRWPYHV
ncbi:hypothetical protein TNCV_1807161 [Trichonephila clavipes]|nr:hypothetical protein TNCV_1807161 [Trichonephila clavipes]